MVDSPGSQHDQPLTFLQNSPIGEVEGCKSQAITFRSDLSKYSLQCVKVTLFQPSCVLEGDHTRPILLDETREAE